MTNEPVTFFAKVSTRWFLTILVFVWTVLCVTLAGVMAYGIATSESALDERVGFLFLMIIAALIAINYVVWQLKGEELLTFHETFMELSKKGTFFKNRMKIEFWEIEEIECDDDRATPYWIKSWGIGGGKIIIRYLGRGRRFGQDLTSAQAGRLTELIMEEFDNRRKSNANLL